MTTAPTPSELLTLRAGATQQVRLREKFGPEGLDLKLDPQIVIRLLDRIHDLEGKVGRFQGAPLPLIEAINAATGSNDWQGEAGPAELLGPACRAIAELEARKPLPLSIERLEQIWASLRSFHGNEPLKCGHVEFARLIEVEYGVLGRIPIREENGGQIDHSRITGGSS